MHGTQPFTSCCRKHCISWKRNHYLYSVFRDLKHMHPGNSHIMTRMDCVNPEHCRKEKESQSGKFQAFSTNCGLVACNKLTDRLTHTRTHTDTSALLTKVKAHRQPKRSRRKDTCPLCSVRHQLCCLFPGLSSPHPLEVN